MSWIQDPGHGGTDPGATANNLIEKTLNLEAGTYVNRRLNELGIKSTLTRTSDVTLDAGPRTAKVRQYKKCISHHFNAGGGAGAEFIHSIYADGKFEHGLAEFFRAAGYPLRPRTVYSRKGSTGKDYYFMHRQTGACRTTIVEYEFLDGPNVAKLKDKKYREGMYECVVRAICADEGVPYKAPGAENNKVTEGLYKVQIGAFSKKENAEALAKELKSKGYATYIVKD